MIPYMHVLLDRYCIDFRNIFPINKSSLLTRHVCVSPSNKTIPVSDDALILRFGDDAIEIRLTVM